MPTGYLSTYALDHGFDEAFSYQILAIFFGRYVIPSPHYIDAVLIM